MRLALRFRRIMALIGRWPLLTGELGGDAAAAMSGRALTATLIDRQPRSGAQLCYCLAGGLLRDGCEEPARMRDVVTGRGSATGGYEESQKSLVDGVSDGWGSRTAIQAHGRQQGNCFEDSWVLMLEETGGGGVGRNTSTREPQWRSTGDGEGVEVFREGGDGGGGGGGGGCRGVVRMRRYSAELKDLKGGTQPGV